MSKVAQTYLEVHPYKIIERGFHKERAQVSESIFSLANEYMGIRGHFDEGISNLPTLRGTYFNGIYDYALEPKRSAYLGIVEKTHFMVNSVDWVSITILINGVKLDLGVNEFKDFYRELDMTSGLLTRSFTYVDGDLHVEFTFKRFVSMLHPKNAYQVIKIKANKTCDISLTFHLDGDVLMWQSDNYFHDQGSFEEDRLLGLSLETLTTEQKVSAVMHIEGPGKREVLKGSKKISANYNLNLSANEEVTYTRTVAIEVDRFNEVETFKINEASAVIELRNSLARGIEATLKENEKFYKDAFETSDITIEGDDVNQQGIRYTLFQLMQTYQGYNPHNNIGAKGLTGEAYSGHAFWDSETYCLPFYLFNNPRAARNLLMFRYNTLEQAKKRALDLDCTGACYPIATLNGEEGCDLWQHASTQLQPSTAVAYAISHYVLVTKDEEFLLNYGLEMLVEISRFLYSRGDYNADGTYFGYYGVMGPDEFQLMVNHNTYTNFMAKKTFEFLESVLEAYENDESVQILLRELNFSNEERNNYKEAAEKMLILYDDETKLFEQHLGFYDLPNIDPKSIPVTEFPLYSHWTYDRIYRNNLIKQPDVLMFMFLYDDDFTSEQKKANYDYYEPKTIHESSLSPSIHSIFASEIGYEEQALDFFGFATRMDLDDYNRNTNEGLHMTSIAASWMNIVYGFGGLRSDGEFIKLNPTIPPIWESYTFKFLYEGQRIKVKVNKEEVEITNTGNKPVTIQIGKGLYLIENVITLKVGDY